MKNKNLVFSLLALIIFAVFAVFYCAPILSGKSIIQPDIVNYRGSAQEMLDYQNQTGENVYWSNSMFSGMPTYQSGAKYDYDFIKKIDRTLRFLPRPADYIFLLFAGFFILGITLFRDWKYALSGSFFFAVAAYYFIVIAAGHNAKIHAIAYFAPLLAGIILLYRGKYLSGFLITTLFAALELLANHIQMTYYLFLAMLIYGLIRFVDALKKKEIAPFFKATALVILAGIFAMGMNAPRLLTTYEFSKETTRGKSELTLLNSNKSGLEKEYITQWSYGKLETFNLFIPNFMGGGSATKQEDLKNYIAELQNQQYSLGDDEFNHQAFQLLADGQPSSTYWGEQPGTSGPAYQGAVVILLFLLGMFLVRGKYGHYKYWLITATILSILLAWGKNFSFLTDLFIDYFPMYDKFRAVSSILVIAEFTMPLLAVFALFVFLQDKALTEEYKRKVLFYVGGSVLGLLLVFYVFGGVLFDFTTSTDVKIKEQFLGLINEYKPDALGFWDSLVNSVQNALRKDRIEIFKADTLRTFVFVLLSLGFLFAYQYSVLKSKLVVVLGIAFLALFDGFQIGKRYLNDDNFVPSFIVDNPFPTEVSPRLQTEAANNMHVRGIAQKATYNKILSDIKKEDKTYYRVYNQVLSTFNETNTSYFASSIGGYHGAKLGKYQDIIDIYFSPSEQTKALGTAEQKYSMQILNLLNTKYFIQQGEQGMEQSVNPDAFGNAWLLADMHWVENADDEILALKDVNLKEKVVLRSDLYPELKSKNFALDSTASIRLVDYSPMKLTYEVQTKTPQMAVFSEIYYPHGWVFSIKKEKENQPESDQIYKADYFLRALPVEAGKSTIIFEFKPSIVKTASILGLISSSLFALLVIAAAFYTWKNKKSNASSIE